MSSVAAATVAWTLAEIDEVLGAVTASSTVGGRKKALETLTEARVKIEAYAAWGARRAAAPVPSEP
jgi:hypothetical protein